MLRETYPNWFMEVEPGTIFQWAAKNGNIGNTIYTITQKPYLKDKFYIVSWVNEAGATVETSYAANSLYQSMLNGGKLNGMFLDDYLMATYECQNVEGNDILMDMDLI